MIIRFKLAKGKNQEKSYFKILQLNSMKHGMIEMRLKLQPSSLKMLTLLSLME